MQMSKTWVKGYTGQIADVLFNYIAKNVNLLPGADEQVKEAVKNILKNGSLDLYLLRARFFTADTGVSQGFQLIQVGAKSVAAGSDGSIEEIDEPEDF